MFRTTTERLSSLLINSASLTVVRGGVGVRAEGLIKGDDLLSPQGEVNFRWETWPPEVLAAASDLIVQMEKHVSACLSGEVRSVPPPGMAIPPAMPESPGPSDADAEFRDDEDIAGSFGIPGGKQPEQY